MLKGEVVVGDLGDNKADLQTGLEVHVETVTFQIHQQHSNTVF